MKKKEIARIILADDGKVHIALYNSKSVFCTANSILSLISDVYAFADSKYKEYAESTRYLNPKRLPLNQIPGLTLAVVNDDTSVEVYYPLLLERVILNYKNDPKIHIDFREYLYTNEFLNQTEFFIKLYLDIMAKPFSDFRMEKSVPISIENQEVILSEIINSRFYNISNEKIPKNQPLGIDSTADSDAYSPLVSCAKREELVPIVDYAQLHDVTLQTIYTGIKKNKYHTARMVDGVWFIDLNEPYPKDGRKGRKGKNKGDGRRQVRIKGNSYEDVQKYIKERKLVTDVIRPYIRTYEEALYYFNNNYHEIEIGLGSDDPTSAKNRALIIDVNPDYYCERLGKTNRQLIQEGNAPVVPDNDEHYFQLHHIGQKSSSPFAILPSNVHNGKDTYTIFHQSKNESDVHGPAFRYERQQFWLRLLKIYDSVNGQYQKIPFLNSKHTKNKR